MNPTSPDSQNTDSCSFCSAHPCFLQRGDVGGGNVLASFLIPVCSSPCSEYSQTYQFTFKNSNAYCLSSLTTQINQVFRTVCLSSHCHHLETLCLADTYHRDAPAWISGLLCCPRNHASCSLQKKPLLVTGSTFLTFLPTTPQVHVPRASFLLNYSTPPQLPWVVTALLNPCAGGSASLTQVFTVSPRWTFE